MLGYEALDAAMKQVVAKARQTPELAGIFTSYEINVPQLYAELDRTKAQQLGVDVQDVFETMQIYLGSLYVNDFNKFGRTYQVIAQADRQFRATPDDILRLKTRNAEGRHGAARLAGARHRHDRARERHALQRLPLGRPQRRPGARLFERPGAAGDHAASSTRPCRRA